MAASVVEQRIQAIPEVQTQTHISLAEILSALSFALDLTEGAMPGHALRTCLLGMRLANELGLSPEQKVSLYYALLLKDVGCSSQAGRLCGIIAGGSAWRARAVAHHSDAGLPLLCSRFDPAVAGHTHAAPARFGIKMRRRTEETSSLEFEKSARIVRKLDVDGTVAEAVCGINEHWDGSGRPKGLRGKEIPLLSRIMAVAQHLDILATQAGPRHAIEAVREQRGRSFDPKVVWIAEWLHRKGSLWTGALPGTPEKLTRSMVLELVPLDVDRLEAADVDLICEAFADVVDARSSFTYRHSQSVTHVAGAIAEEMNLDEERVQFVRRAALLHDIGKLRVPNAILDKPGSLDRREWDVVHEHPRLTREILSHIAAFEELSMVAGAHHERLDGSGYPDHLRGDEIPLEARIIAVADAYDALTEDRPYRQGLTHEEAMALIWQEAPHRLDPECCEALAAAVSMRTRCTIQ